MLLSGSRSPTSLLLLAPRDERSGDARLAKKSSPRWTMACVPAPRSRCCRRSANLSVMMVACSSHRAAHRAAPVAAGRSAFLPCCGSWAIGDDGQQQREPRRRVTLSGRRVKQGRAGVGAAGWLSGWLHGSLCIYRTVKGVWHFNAGENCIVVTRITANKPRTLLLLAASRRVASHRTRSRPAPPRLARSTPPLASQRYGMR